MRPCVEKRRVFLFGKKTKESIEKPCVYAVFR